MRGWGGMRPFMDLLSGCHPACVCALLVLGLRVRVLLGQGAVFTCVAPWPYHTCFRPWSCTTHAGTCMWRSPYPMPMCSLYLSPVRPAGLCPAGLRSVMWSDASAWRCMPPQSL